VNLTTGIINVYEAARARGESRCDAFVRAVRFYRTRRPDLPVDRAGTEVARILLSAAHRPHGVEHATSELSPPAKVSYAETN
jgi:hypothetical protein